MSSPYGVQPLDVPLKISVAEEQFLEMSTGIADPEMRRAHVMVIQKKAYTEIYSYPCIRSFNFLRFKIANHFEYPKVIARQGGILLDLGCCFGTDVRKVAADGYPLDQLLGAELQPKFIEMGYELFIDTPAKAPHFVVGDIFDTSFFDPTAAIVPTLAIKREETTLVGLKGRVKYIHAGSFFHLFDEATQLKLAHIVAALLVNEPGSTVFGSHVGMMESGIRNLETERGGMFCHNPTTFAAVWQGIYGADKVKVDARLVERGISGMAPPGDDSGDHWKGQLLIWSVVLL